jgi:hypothetical protein
MNPAEATLHAVASEPVTAAAAIAWFAAGTEAIGYTQDARAATWLRARPDGSIEHHHDGDLLADAYELVVFDGHRELRWLRGPDGHGPAVAVGEDPAQLPAGRDVTAEPPPRRGERQTRLLAGAPRPHTTPGWTVLASERYATAHLPCSGTIGDVLVIDTIEYLTEDEHGNRDIADTRTVALRAITPAAIPTPTGEAAGGPERTSA